MGSYHKTPRLLVAATAPSTKHQRDKNPLSLQPILTVSFLQVALGPPMEILVVFINKTKTDLDVHFLQCAFPFYTSGH